MVLGQAQMEMTFSAGDLASLVQLFLSFATLAVAIVTLYLLKRYVEDTSTLAKTAVQQIEQGYIPYLTLHGPWDPLSTSGAGPVVINHGKGPAIHALVRYSKYKYEGIFEDHEEELPDIAVGSHMLVSIRFNEREPIVISYRSLSGQPYETRIEVEMYRPATVSFRQLPR